MNSISKGTLYLIPVNISDAPLESVIPMGNLSIVRQLKCLIVENVRTARRFLKRWDKSFDIDSITFHELNGHTDLTHVGEWLEPLRRGESVGIMSEAGCPAVADPGAVVVDKAQREGYKVVPLVGPSSILLSLMASGFNGQGFAFNGYLPIEKGARVQAIRDLESESRRKNRTEIFIETPYRNNGMVSFLAENLRSDTMLCVASDVTDPERESIKSMPARLWKNCTENYDKRPAIFLIYCGAESKDGRPKKDAR